MWIKFQEFEIIQLLLSKLKMAERWLNPFRLDVYTSLNEWGPAGFFFSSETFEKMVLKPLLKRCSEE